MCGCCAKRQDLEAATAAYSGCILDSWTVLRGVSVRREFQGIMFRGVSPPCQTPAATHYSLLTSACVAAT